MTLWKGEFHDVVKANTTGAVVSLGKKERLFIPRGMYEITCWKPVEAV